MLEKLWPVPFLGRHEYLLLLSEVYLVGDEQASALNSLLPASLTMGYLPVIPVILVSLGVLIAVSLATSRRSVS